MPRYEPVSRTRHLGKTWRLPSGFSFAANAALLPLAAAELGTATLAFPIAFAKQNDKFLPVAVLAPMAGRNLFVGPSGEWLGTYIPASLRTYPFILALAPNASEWVLCIDEDAQVETPSDRPGEDFYDDSGELTPRIRALLEFLFKLEKSKEAAATIAKAIASAGILCPWELKLSVEGREVGVTGLYRVDETILEKIPESRFLELRKAFALPLIYAQLLSMGNIRLYEILLARRAESDGRRRGPEVQGRQTLGDFQMTADEVIRFS